VQGKILIVDSIATNRIVLKVKLAAACYTVVQASCVKNALTMAEIHMPDLVICAMTLSDGEAADLCRAMRRNPVTRPICVLALQGTGDAASRVALLKAGAQDVLPKPLDDTLLLGRVRSLLRAQNADAEWQLREDTSRALGLAEPDTPYAEQGRTMFVCASPGTAHSWAIQMRPHLNQQITQTAPDTLMQTLQKGALPDTFVLILPGERDAAQSMLRCIAALRANAQTRHAGVLVLQTKPDAEIGASALDLGADDLMTAGFNPAELSLRLKALLRRKRIGEQMRATVRTGLKAAVNDPLTGLYNRRYAMPYLAQMAVRARDNGTSFAVMIADLDHFKRINDQFGHASGDAVLVAVAHRLRGCLRKTDMVARIGGEEFLIVTPAPTLAQAQTAALRVCDAISSSAINLPPPHAPVTITASIGMALCDLDRHPAKDCDDIGEALLAQADKALYAAKGRGRNQVKLGRPAA